MLDQHNDKLLHVLLLGEVQCQFDMMGLMLVEK